MQVRTLFLLALCVNLPAQLWGDDQNPLYTDPAEADADFAFQGEYAGWQRSQPSHRSSEPVGLQVVARGDGRFDAVKYTGGLPGRNWFGDSKYRLSGERIDSFVELRGELYDIILEEDGAATVYARDGRVAGELERVRRISPTLGLIPPPDAVVLFGTGESGRLKNPKLTEDGLLLPGTETAEPYRDFRLHAEFRLPYKPFANEQSRGNSGVYLQGRYEVQILDSFGLDGLNNECGALYKLRAPDVNMCLPPLEWQTYDIDFRAARFDGATKTRDARITVWHNGVPVHADVAIPNKTGAGKPEGPEPLPILLQDHGNPVVFRNLWLIETGNDSYGLWRPFPPDRLPPLPLQPLL
jgi:hypothetical protein